MDRILFPSGVPTFSDDLDAIETLRKAETLVRWQDDYRLGDSGVVASSISENVLFPTTGATTGQVVLSAGSAYFLNGEHVTVTGGTITGLTPASITGIATAYILLNQATEDYSSRAHDVTGGTNYVRRRNATGSTIFTVGAHTSPSTQVILGTILSIDGSNNVTIDATYSSGRRIVSPTTATKPSAPTSLVLETGLDKSLEFTASGDPESVSGLTSSAYIKATWYASTHVDGIWGYLVNLRLCDAAGAVLSGRTMSQLVVTDGITHTYTGTTFHGLHPGLRATVRVAAISKSMTPVMSDWLSTGSTIILGRNNPQTMPSVSAVARTGGVELAWDVTDSAATGITEFEVFASTNSIVTGATINYGYLVYRGYTAKVLVPAEIGDVIYFKVRGHDASGRVTSNSRVLSHIFNGPSAPPIPQNVLAVSGYVRNDAGNSQGNFVHANFGISAYAGSKLNRPYIEVSWGWEGQGGAWVADGEFDISPAGLSLLDTTGGTASVSGWCLVFQSYSDLSQYHRITGNTQGRVSCNVIPGYNYGADHSGKFWITPAADAYDVELSVVQADAIPLSQTTGGGAPGGGTSCVIDPQTSRPITAVNRTLKTTISSVDSFIRIDNLVLGYAYQVKVTSIGRSGQRSAASAAKIVVAGLMTMAVSVVMPVVVYNVYGTRVAFRWNALNNVIGYEVAYTVDGTPPSFTDNNSSVVFIQRNQIDISVQAGETLRAVFRAVGLSGQISSNEISLSVTIGVPAGYYGLSAYNVSVNYSATASPAVSGVTEILVDFPFAFVVRYMSIYATASNLPTGQTLEFKTHPLGEPNSDNHISADWIITNLNQTVREAGTINVRADGAVTLRIDGSAVTSGTTWSGIVTLWFEQSDITPPGDGGSGPRNEANVVNKRTYQKYSTD